MKVLAKIMGFDGMRRIRPGEVFEMDDKFIHFDEKGNLVKPLWVVPATEKPVDEVPTYYQRKTVKNMPEAYAISPGIKPETADRPDRILARQPDLDRLKSASQPEPEPTKSVQEPEAVKEDVQVSLPPPKGKKKPGPKPKIVNN